MRTHTALPSVQVLFGLWPAGCAAAQRVISPPRVFGPRTHVAAPRLWIPWWVQVPLLLALSACDREQERLEERLSIAERHRYELQRMLDQPGDRTADRWLDQVLPDRGVETFGATVAVTLARLPELGEISVERTPPPETTAIGLVNPHGIAVEVEARIEAIARGLGALSTIGHPWHLDRIDRPRPGRARIFLHSFSFVPNAASAETSTTTLDPGPDEESFGSGARDRLRQRLRDELRAIEQLELELRARGLTAKKRQAYREHELKRTWLGDLESRAAPARKDAAQLLQVLSRAGLMPLELELSVKRGRRVCIIRFEQDADRHRFAALATAELSAATNEEHSEVVLPSGRSCAVKAGVSPG